MLKKYKYIEEGYKSPSAIGTPFFEDYIRFATCYIEPLTISKSMTFLDYGCGDGRLANFLSAHIKKFKYYGIEHPESTLVDLSKSSPFFNDSRCHFGLMGTDYETEALEKSKYVALCSVFTHLKIEDFYIIMEKFENIIKHKNGEVVFSAFIEGEYRYEPISGCYDVANCHSRVFYTKKQLKDFAEKKGYILTEHESYLAQGENLHRIFKISKQHGEKEQLNETNINHNTDYTTR